MAGRLLLASHTMIILPKFPFSKKHKTRHPSAFVLSFPA